MTTTARPSGLARAREHRRVTGRWGGGVARTAAAFVLAVGLVCLLAVPAGSREAPTAEPLEYAVKASYLLNFAAYVTWPEEAFASPDAPIVIAVLGNDPFGEILDETALKHPPKGKRPVVVRRYKSPYAVDAHVVFISRNEKERIPSLLAPLLDRPILTVGDSDDFLKLGGGIRLVIVEDRVRFEVNLEATRELHVHPLMLRSAKSVVRRQPKADE